MLVPQTGKHAKQVIHEGVVECMQTAFTRSTYKSIRRASWELQLHLPNAHDIVQKHLRLHTYKIQLCQHITSNDHLRAESATETLLCTDEKNLYLDTVCFSYEATLQPCGKSISTTAAYGGIQTLMSCSNMNGAHQKFMSDVG